VNLSPKRESFWSGDWSTEDQLARQDVGPGIAVLPQLAGRIIPLRPGRVLVNGAGGAVGGYVVQLARHAGAQVTATADPRSAERVRSYGAERVVDYTTSPVADAAPGPFDLVVNLAPTSPEDTDALAALAADGGVFVTATMPPPVDPRPGSADCADDGAQ
jgi:NADPH:quinone reductase-like Zn-dependent oxidoreductase